MRFYHTQCVNEQGHLMIGGIDIIRLKQMYGTPLYIMDETHIRKQCRWFKNNFDVPGIDSEVIYASKAFMTIAMAKLVKEEGLSLDVVSGGELYTAHKAGYPMEDVYFHGNNKSLDELRMALEYNVGTLVVDNVFEVEKLLEILKPEASIKVLLRINPGIEAHTHAYIATTKNSSKFGLSIFDPQTLSLIQKLDAEPRLQFLGFHSHIGSQIFEESSFIEHGKTVMRYCLEVKEKTGIEITSINLGGGFGVRYTRSDKPVDSPDFLRSILTSIKDQAAQYGLNTPRVMIEPGRAIVAASGITLYEVGSTKTTYAKKRYCFVDGSMADHLRTALYQADYHAVLANRMQDEPELSYTVTGKACESGDIIIRSVHLPEPKPEDLLVVFSTGAYHYSMASNYNRLVKPPVVFVKNGEARLVVRGETYADLISHDVDVIL